MNKEHWDGYDFALQCVHPKTQLLLSASPTSSAESRIDLLLEQAKTYNPSFKKGVAQFIDDWWRLHASLQRVQENVLPSIEKLCHQCGQALSTENETSHLDMHFRRNKLQSILLHLDEHEKSLSKPLISAHTKRTPQPYVLMRMLQEPLRDATRKRVLQMLHPTQTECESKPQPVISRGWFIKPCTWATATCTNVPNDVLQFGRMVTKEGRNFWKTTFPKLDVPSHWDVWLVNHSKYMVTTGIAATSLLPRVYGSDMYMHQLTDQERATFIRAEDRFDQRLCALCGEGFKIVLSRDPNDVLDEDYVLLFAIVDPISRQVLHEQCYVAMKADHKAHTLESTRPKPVSVLQTAVAVVKKQPPSTNSGKKVVSDIKRQKANT